MHEILEESQSSATIQIDDIYLKPNNMEQALSKESSSKEVILNGAEGFDNSTVLPVYDLGLPEEPLRLPNHEIYCTRNLPTEAI